MKLHKITTTAAEERPKRHYDDACGTAHALDLIGERWAILIIRELMFGPKRFGELRSGLPGISANILTQRLDGLEAAHILLRRQLPPPASIQVYELTPWGYEAEPLIQIMGRWATRSPGHDPSLPLSSASIMLSFRTMIDPQRAGALQARIGFRFGLESFLADLSGGHIAITRTDASAAAAIFDTEPALLAAAVYGGRSFASLEAGGRFSVLGDRMLAENFVTLFPLPEKFVPASR